MCFGIFITLALGYLINIQLGRVVHQSGPNITLVTYLGDFWSNLPQTPTQVWKIPPKNGKSWWWKIGLAPVAPWWIFESKNFFLENRSSGRDKVPYKTFFRIGCLKVFFEVQKPRYFRSNVKKVHFGRGSEHEFLGRGVQKKLGPGSFFEPRASSGNGAV